MGRLTGRRVVVTGRRHGAHPRRGARARPHGITVNCLCPGYILDAREAAGAGGHVASWSALSPLGRLGEPQDVARAALFLASSDSDYLTGDALNVAGGMALH